MVFSRGRSLCLQTYLQNPGGKGPVPGVWKSTQLLSSLKLETHRRKQGRHGDAATYSTPGPRCCRVLRPRCRAVQYSVSTEQLLIFFLAIWFFYFFYL